MKFWPVQWLFSAMLILACGLCLGLRPAPQEPCTTGAACQCDIESDGASGNAFERCPCQRLYYCCSSYYGYLLCRGLGYGHNNCYALNCGGSSNTVPETCCTRQANDLETPCVTIVMTDEKTYHGCCLEQPACEVELGCAVYGKARVTIALCCSSSSDIGGTGTTGQYDCSAAKCCAGDAVNVFPAGYPGLGITLNGLGDNGEVENSVDLACGESQDADIPLITIQCESDDSIYTDPIGAVNVNGITCGNPCSDQ